MKFDEEWGGKEMKLKLVIDLVPKTAWYSNLRKNIPKSEWDKIRKQCYADADHRCTICRVEGRLNCHEIYEYDDKKHIQKLKGFIALCGDCHMIKHIGFAGIQAEKELLDMDKLIEHFMKVNNVDRKTFDNHNDESFKIWRERSQHEWTTDLAECSELVSPPIISKEKMGRNELSELWSVPLVGMSRAKILLDAGIRNIRQLAEMDKHHELSKHPSFLGAFDLIINYAKAIVADKPLIVGNHPFFKDIENKNIYFFDAEYDPVGTKKGPFGMFLLGWMDTAGKVWQLFLDDPKDEKEMLEEFNEWLIKEKPTLVTYSSKSADEPQLINSFRRFSLPIKELKNIFFDLYYDCINTYRMKDQFIFLPMRHSMGVKNVSDYLGYEEPSLEIHDGLMALINYKRFLDSNDKKIKKELRDYNATDLERTKYIFDKLTDL